ncbi:MAG: type II toxin-antitoxin system RelE/ParE family toxin [Acidobacteriia bacterium]|nr:type II toxin-antitoxin system RelE/ParE family toxin [Terriglobia bacterium]
MSGFVFHPEALADLDEIWEFIAQDKIDAADRVIAEIFDAVCALARFAHQGTRPTSHRGLCGSSGCAITLSLMHPMKHPFG